MTSLLAGLAGLSLIVIGVALFDPRFGVIAGGAVLTFLAYVNAGGQS